MRPFKSGMNWVIGKVVSFWRWAHIIWDDIEWPLVLFLGLCSMVIGVVGFDQYYNQIQNRNLSFFDLIYLSIQLFTMESGSVDNSLPIPFSLQIARFSSPVIAGYTLFQALKEIFKDQVLLINLLRTRNHYLIIGLGKKGFRLVNNLCQANHPVIVIEKDATNPYIQASQRMGALVVIGDARENLILQKAGLQRAKIIIALCGEDETNIEITEQARTIVGHQRELVAKTHISDPYLWTLLKESELTTNNDDRFRLELFSIYDSGARILLREAASIKNTEKVHIVIIGMGKLAEYLIIHLTYQWALECLETYGKIKLSIIDPNANRNLSALRMRFPLIDDICSFDLCPYQTDWPEFLEEQKKFREVSHVFVCIDHAFLGIQTGVYFSNQLKSQKAQVIIRTDEDLGFASLLRESHSPGFENITPFSLLERTCRVELFDDGTHENLARVIHESYLQHEINQGKKMGENTSLLPWDELSEELHQSNRNQADQISLILRNLGYGIKPWQDMTGLEFKLSESEIEKMAQLEHERWLHEKEQQGWQFASHRDNAKKLHPDLTPWQNLSKTSKEKTRQAVRVIPKMLLYAGFQIYPIKQAANY